MCGYVIATDHRYGKNKHRLFCRSNNWYTSNKMTTYILYRIYHDINDGCDVYVTQMLASTNQCVHEIFKI